MQWPYVLGLGYSIVLALIYGVGHLSRAFILVASNILFPATAGVAVVVSFSVLQKYVGFNPKPMFSMAWVCFSAGIFLWFIGELMWTFNALFGDRHVFTIFAGVVYLVGYLPMFFALFLILKLFKPFFSKRIMTLQLAVSVAVSALVSYLLVVPIFHSTEGTLTTALAAVFPIFDVGLLSVAFAILLVFIDGSIGKAWLFLLSSLILNIAADLLFTYVRLQGLFYEGHPLELFWLWGYVAVMLGLYVHRREL